MSNFEQTEQKILAAEANRVIYWFDLPKSLAASLGATKIGFVELTADEELRCATRARGDQLRLGFELVKESLRFVDGRKLQTADDSADSFWGSRTPGMSRLRQLAMAAYTKLHSPDAEEAKDFLASQSSQI